MVIHSDVLARLRDEHKELHDKTRALSHFLKSEKFHELPDTQKQLLTLQHGHMVNYRYVLEQRLAHIQAERELALDELQLGYVPKVREYEDEYAQIEAAIKRTPLEEVEAIMTGSDGIISIQETGGHDEDRDGPLSFTN